MGIDTAIFRKVFFVFLMFLLISSIYAKGTRYEIEESSDWISKLNTNISSGDTIMFITDGGNYYTSEDGVLPAVDLVLMAKPGLEKKPILSTGSSGTLLKVNANITIKGLSFNGYWNESGENGPYRLLRVNSDFQKMIIENCDFYNGRAYGVVSTGPVLDSLFINNSTFNHMDKAAIYFKDVAGIVNRANITNSSFWDISDIGIYIYESADSVIVSNNTFYGLTNINAYLKECLVGTVVRDNIFMSDSAMAIKVYGSSTIVEYNCFYNNSTDIEYVGDPQLDFSIDNIFTDPLFENAGEGNFALASNSLCIGSAHNGSNLGDPRWGTYDINSDSTSILFSVSVPGYTPETDTIFIASSINNWDSAGFAMTKVADSLWQYNLRSVPNTTIEYKYTRGSWETVEKDAGGSEISNRIIEVDTTSIVTSDTVESWRDISTPQIADNIAPILSYFNNSPQTSIAVTWASKSTGLNTIYYGINDISENQMIVDNYETLIEDGDSLIHIAFLNELTPNTTYKYKVETQGVYVSDELSFTTADSSNEFKFVVGGDNQLALVPEVLEKIKSEDPKFMIHCGDLVVDGRNTSEWYTFLSRFEDFTGKYSMMPVYGNHESDSPTMRRLFQHPSNFSTDSDNEGHWFSFNYNNVHFVGLDNFRDYKNGSEQYTWLENDLSSISPDIDHIIVYFHHPMYSNGGYHGPNLLIRKELEPLFIQHGVDLVFSGHNHWYERSKANGITYITTGGMSEHLKDFADLSSNEWSLYIEKVNHYCRVSIDGPDLKVEMVRSDGTIGDSYESMKVDGSDSDWINSGINPVLDTDNLQTDNNLKLDRLFISEDIENFYFGFDAPANDKGISYGLYIDVDNVEGSGGNTDRWGKAISAVDKHLPEIQIYAYHKDDDSWSSSSPKYYSWDTGASDWVGASGGMGSLPEGGLFAIDKQNRFYELSVPKSSPGFDGASSFSVKLFTVGETDGVGASDAIPSDTIIQFTTENTSTDVTVLSDFFGYNISEPEIPDTNIIQTDGNPSDWLDLGIEPLAMDTDNAQNFTEYKMDSLFVLMDTENIYLGFSTPVETIGLHFGIYIDTDNTIGSGGTYDKWGAGVTAIDKHLPDVAIYAYHGETGAWSGTSPKYYQWNGTTWEQNVDMSGDGSLPPGGKFNHDVDYHFTEIMVPRSSIGFANVDSFYISLFNFGSKKFICETIPSDNAVKFTGENTSETIQISNFAYYEYDLLNSSNKHLVNIPSNFSISQNYPNPFNPTTKIKYSLPEQSKIKIEIFNMLGQRVNVLVNQDKSAGNHEITWDAKNLSSGIYLISIRADGLNSKKSFNRVKKAILLK